MATLTQCMDGFLEKGVGLPLLSFSALCSQGFPQGHLINNTHKSAKVELFSATLPMPQSD